ncbi:hypothetical protein CC1G_09677 [Coprinopsis cinerea okayama7|uniref:Uncharacterized protein n=1 Tax=Coprinopsis cinerea (strain Okayama-7 / 130 / ATCC MYA-4618 / FGSC 9003) TaxID=240176 RepID=A8P9H6_COPC7|nr:hypothetical protein CC1G_09677 [Coprinopsis cinerea okayama7\|eukprot:XP_001839774.2 hypothetical protein CC1G_09677 [Coprinopsis cinerea okayama7\
MPVKSRDEDRRFFASKCIPIFISAEMGLRPWRRFVREMGDDFPFPCASCINTGEPCEVSPDLVGCLSCLRRGTRCTAHDDCIQHALMRHFPASWRNHLFSTFYDYHGYHAYARGRMHSNLGGLNAVFNGVCFSAAHSLFPQLIPNQATSVIATRVAALTRRQSLPRLTAALDQLREATFVLAIGRSVMQQQHIARHILLHDIASILKSIRHGCLPSQRGLALIESIFKDRGSDVWSATRFPYGPCPELRALLPTHPDLD